MSASLELEIKHLLAQEESLEKVIEQVVQTAENEGDEIGYDQVLTLCRFLWHAQAHSALINFVFKNWQNLNFKIPWEYFTEALSSRMTPELAEILWEGIDQESATNLACKSQGLDAFFPEMKQKRADLRIEAIKSSEIYKEELLEELQTFRVQQMVEQEKKTLQKLLRLFPNDTSLKQQSSDFRERNALEVINRISPIRKSLEKDEPRADENTIKAQEAWGRCLEKLSKDQPELSYEIAIAAFFMGLYEISLSILNSAPDSEALLWFRCELYLKNHRYVDLLQSIAQLEVQLAANSETFFATAYYRAQAFWGLGQKHLAIEVMEGLLAARPNYRMGVVLLNHWRTQ